METTESMEEFVKKLLEQLATKEMTAPGDIVLLAGMEPRFAMFARVGAIERDPAKRDEWWHVHLTLLGIPLQQVVWTLRTEQMTGREIFTMDGKPRFMKAIAFRDTTKRPVPQTKNKGPVLRRVK